MKYIKFFSVGLVFILSFSTFAAGHKKSKTVAKIKTRTESRAPAGAEKPGYVRMCTNASPPPPPPPGLPHISQATCRAPSPMTEADMATPTSIAAFATTNHLNLRDTVCCMPADWRSHYVVASTSPSLQAATPDNPRIIIGPRTSPRDAAPGKAVAFYLDGSGSIEMLDQHQNVSRYSDISFSQEQIEGQTRSVARTSLASESCTECHGATSNPTPLFSFAPIWPNTFPKFYKPTVCPTAGERAAFEDERRRIQAAIRRPGSLASCLPGFDRTIDTTGEEDICNFYDRTVDADPNCNRNVGRPIGAFSRMTADKAAGIQANLDEFSQNRLGLMTENFEISVIETSHEAMAREIVRWSDYPQYKYALVGAMVGCMQPSGPHAEHWFPPAELQRQSMMIAGHQTMSFETNAIASAREWQTIVHSNAAVDNSVLVNNVTCQGPAVNFQDGCFPDSQCSTVSRMVRNLQETLTLARAAEAQNGAANKVNAEILRSIATANWDLRRNWIPIGCGNRNGDPDNWGATRYITTIMPSHPALGNIWATLFTSARNQRIVDTMARKLIAIDPDLRRVIPDQSVSPCVDLQNASIRAFGGSPQGSGAEQTQSVEPVQPERSGSDSDSSGDGQ